ncbi:hypothetical protein RHO13_05680 [Orbus wheelerorum]|uniref:hypothetical protein n=1 Tax=Orbus wheelerorum TaxID=3074111 RepID=UPI00370DD29E
MIENFKIVAKAPLVLVFCFALILSGCQAMNNSSVDPELTNNNSAEFFSKSGWQACAMGAGIGGIGCYLINQKNPAACLVAAAVSCGIAMGGNYYLDAKRSQYANEEQRLNAYIEDVKANTAQVKLVSDSAKKVLDKNLATLKILDKQIAENKINTDEAQQQLKSIDANISYLNEKLANMKTTEKDWRTISTKEKGSGVNVAKLDAQITQLNKQITVLEKQINLVTQQRSALRIA